MKSRVPALVLGFVLLLGACSNSKSTGSGTAGAPQCPCSCPCTPSAAASPGAPPGPVGPGPSAPTAGGDLGELVASASRKMFHDDGAGCLADLDRVRALDPKLDERMAVTRGQCEMLAGKCQEGKKRVSDWYVREINMSQERADTIAEQLGAMRCRGGNTSERDQLLVALQNLMDGAYVNKQEPAFCRENLETAKRLFKRVPPNGPDDTRISAGEQALFNTAANCFARAGDCASAYKAYRDNYPSKGLAAVKDPKQREDIVRQSFDGTVTLCKKP